MRGALHAVANKRTGKHIGVGLHFFKEGLDEEVTVGGCVSRKSDYHIIIVGKGNQSVIEQLACWTAHP